MMSSCLHLYSHVHKLFPKNHVLFPPDPMG